MKKKLSVVLAAFMIMWMAALAWAVTKTGNFSVAQSASGYVYMNPGDKITFSLTPSEATIGFIGTAYFETTRNSLTLNPVNSYTGTVGAGSIKTVQSRTFINDSSFPLFARLRLDNIDDANTSASLDYVFTEVPNYKERIITTGAKAGTTAGFVVNDGNNIGLIATLPQNKTNSTLVVPISGMETGDVIVGFHLSGQIENTAAGTAHLDVDLRKLNAVASDVTDASLDTMTQLSVVADTAITDSNTLKILATPEVVDANETFYFLIEADSGTSVDMALEGASVLYTH